MRADGGRKPGLCERSRSAVVSRKNAIKRILARVGEHGQAGRWIKFTSTGAIAARLATLSDHLCQAIAVEEAGRKVALKKSSAFPTPAELQSRLDVDRALRAAFEALTPGRRKSYFFYISSAKQAKTREARADKCVPLVLAGRGALERPARPS